MVARRGGVVNEKIPFNNKRPAPPLAQVSVASGATVERESPAERLYAPERPSLNMAPSGLNRQRLVKF